MKIKSILLPCCLFIFLISCQQADSTTKQGMVKVTILYPSSDGSTFNMDYYATKHMPMVAELMGESLKHWSIDKGISGRTPEEPLPYMAIGYLYFDQLSDYQESFGPNAKQIVGDIPNYTNVQPVVQISEIFH
nr:EthD family reductase [Allomuricauda sp.]